MIGDYGIDIILQSAATLKAIAIAAPDKFIKESVARACNSAAATGELWTEWTGNLSISLKTELTSLGIKFYNKNDGEGQIIPNVWILEWK